MKLATVCSFLIALSSASCSGAQVSRAELEYYVAQYAAHYSVPLGFVRALIEQESAWHPCAVSSKGAAGLMQLMPETARRLHVSQPCDIHQNLSGGMRYLAHLLHVFHGDLRLVAAAYYAGEDVISRKGLRYSNREVVAYVAAIRMRVRSMISGDGAASEPGVR